MAMPDGNTAALRQHEAAQARAEREAPTADELERYVQDWLERKSKKLGTEFVMEALVESTIEHQSAILKAYQGYDMTELARATHRAIEAYWRPSAEAAAAEHDFAADRQEA